MKLTNNELSTAVRLALMGVSAVAGMSALPVFAQDANKDSPKLETIEVTGSNIRRIDVETAAPVVTIDKAAIAQSGKLTLGDLVQDLPNIAGPQTNPRVNNSGGAGGSSISLRGLGAGRTLVLVNGRRINNADVNSIPANAVERIDVLTDGASATYGSDAIGGVVNFILRKDYQGAEFSTDYGISDRDDGERKGYHFVFGQTSDKGSIMAGVDYNKQDPVPAGNRVFSSNARYYYYGQGHIAGGSGRTPTGNITLPATGALHTQYGCGAVTLKTGATGTSLGDYRCYTPADGYNFQANGNVDLTAQERTSAFLIGNYKLSDSVETYLEVYHNKTDANSSLAPYPADTTGSTLSISSQSYYNPFGLDFNSNGGYHFRTRFTSLGFRQNHNTTTSDQVVAGFKGTIADTSWQWNTYFNYGHTSQLSHTSGYVNIALLNAHLGPSFLNSAGVVQCGTADNPGSLTTCTPINLFNVNDPNTIAALKAASANPFTQTLTTEKTEAADISGNLFDLPAGPIQLAAGVSHRSEYQNTNADSIEIPDATGACAIGSGCVSPLQGGYTVKEAYAELLIPILKDVPFANSLNLDLGDRYSKYSNFGSTSNWKAAIEYRPIEDLLLRGTVTKVFRAPTVSDLFSGTGQDAPQAVDPCFGLNASQLNANRACTGVVPNNPDGTFHKAPGSTSQINGITSGSVAAGTVLTPEFGKSFDWGFVYDPHFIPGLSLSVDMWRVYLENNISEITAQNALNLCASSGTYCNLIHRFTTGSQAGQINNIQEPIGNLGRLDTKGVDLQAHYRLPETAFGKFGINFQTTYLTQFNDDPAPGLPGDTVQNYAGHYSTGASAIAYANYSRWRALTQLNWNLGSFDAMWTVKYIGKYNVGYDNVAVGISACQSNSPPGCELKYGATVYHNIQLGYNIAPINTRVDVGIDNVGDKQPAIIYQNNTLNANVDVNTFDTIGRYYWARVTVKF